MIFLYLVFFYSDNSDAALFGFAAVTTDASRQAGDIMLSAQRFSGCSPMRIMLFVSIILFTFGLLVFNRDYGYLADALKTMANDKASSTQFRPSDDGDSSLDDPAKLLFHLWKPLVHDMREEVYRSSDGKEYKLPDGPREWTQPLGKKVLILDVDSRFDDTEGTLFNGSTLHREGIEDRSAGRLGHMIYAMVHGYDYRFVRAPDWPGRYGTWTKVPILKEAVRQYDTVVFFDADAWFVHMDLPLEWLMNYWKVTKDTSITLAKDPDTTSNRDSKGLVLYNTGFIIAQKSDRTQEILSALEDCPDEKRWPGCAKWKKSFAHEQRAFGEYVRYEYDKTTDILPIIMQDANSPKGIFIRHDWPKKRDRLEDLQRGFMDMLIARSHMLFQDELHHYYRDLSKLKFPLNEVGV